VRRCRRDETVTHSPADLTESTGSFIPGEPGQSPGGGSADIEARHITGHWEGDPIVGRANRSAIGTLVERCSRFTRLVYLPMVAMSCAAR
jgi:IS30 family transposase